MFLYLKTKHLTEKNLKQEEKQLSWLAGDFTLELGGECCSRQRTDVAGEMEGQNRLLHTPGNTQGHVDLNFSCLKSFRTFQRSPQEIFQRRRGEGEMFILPTEDSSGDVRETFCELFVSLKREKETKIHSPHNC